MTAKILPFPVSTQGLDVRSLGTALNRAMELPASDAQLDLLMQIADRLVTNCQDVPRTPRVIEFAMRS